jgi:single-strand DNA-binding protein
MRSVNKVILLGRAGKDPEIKSTANGMTIANLSLATDESRKDQQGNGQKETTWHNLVAFKKTAEIIQQYVQKGSVLYVEGKIQTRSWEKDGVKQYRTEIVVNELTMLDGGQKRDPVATFQPGPSEIQEVDDSDIPF